MENKLETNKFQTLTQDEALDVAGGKLYSASPWVQMARDITDISLAGTSAYLYSYSKNRAAYDVDLSAAINRSVFNSVIYGLRRNGL